MSKTIKIRDIYYLALCNILAEVSYCEKSREYDRELSLIKIKYMVKDAFRRAQDV